MVESSGLRVTRVSLNHGAGLAEAMGSAHRVTLFAGAPV